MQLPANNRYFKKHKAILLQREGFFCFPHPALSKGEGELRSSLSQGKVYSQLKIGIRR